MRILRHNVPEEFGMVLTKAGLLDEIAMALEKIAYSPGHPSPGN